MINEEYITAIQWPWWCVIMPTESWLTLILPEHRKFLRTFLNFGASNCFYCSNIFETWIGFTFAVFYSFACKGNLWHNANYTEMFLGCCSDEEKDEAGQRDKRFNLQCPGRPSSIETPTTERWVRAESSDTLRRLMSGSELWDRGGSRNMQYLRKHGEFLCALLWNSDNMKNISSILISLRSTAFLYSVWWINELI